MRIGILEPSNFSQHAAASLEQLGEVSLYDDQNLDRFLRDKDVLFVRLGYYLDTEFLGKGPQLRYVCTPTTGLNHIDLQAAAERDIQILSLKGEFEFLKTIRATPENTIGLTLALLRRYKDAFRSTANPAWDRDPYRGDELFESVVGIIGFGRVGRLLAKYFQCFGSKVCFYDIDPSVEAAGSAWREDTIESLIDTSDIVILAASFSLDNHAFFNKRYIDQLTNKYFVNIARGELVDEEALADKVEEGTLKGVALDVIDNETGNNNLDRFLKLVEEHNLIVTPHISGATNHSMQRTEEFVTEKLVHLLRHKSSA